MATLEDKILGEKLENYCSSSEESDRDDDDDDNPEKKTLPNTQEPEPLEVNKWEGTSTNTGPKGVIKDWQRYKQLENEKRVEDDREKIALMKKLTLSVQTALDEEKEKALLEEDAEFADLLNDDFLLNYQKNRMLEIMQQTEHNQEFGKLYLLTDSQQFLDAIDKEDKSVKVIVHIYETSEPACALMNSCLRELCKIYKKVKFCAILTTIAGMSKQFQSGGVPALLVYKGGQLVGNFIKLSKELGNNFEVEDVQSYLIEHGMIEDKSLTPALIKQTESNNSDSD